MVALRITHPDQLRRCIPECSRMFSDFLTRAREPFTLDQQWAAILRSLGQPHFLMLVAFDARVRPVGYLLAQAGWDWWGLRYVNIIQVYATPGTRHLLPDLHARVEQWAEHQGAQFLSGLTARDSPGYARWIRAFGFTRGPVLYLKPRRTDDGEAAASATTGHPDHSG
jgi:hypothetical protein